jgi:glutamate 5-kinase
MLKKIRKKIKDAKRIVIKVGTQVLTENDGDLAMSSIKNLIKEITYAKEKLGKEIVLVSSGAIGAGMGELKIKKRPKTMPELQALASIGQGRLIQVYHDLFKKKGIKIGQVLLTLDDLRHRKRHLNTSNTLMTLLSKGLIPVVN